LTQFSSSVWQCLHSLVTSYNRRGDLFIRDRQTMNLLHWLHEAQNPHTHLKAKCIQFRPSTIQLSPLDFHVLGYCISHSNCGWDLDLSLSNFDSTSVKMISNSCTAVASRTASASGHISRLYTSHNCCDKSLCSILELPHTILQGLKSISFGNITISTSLDKLAKILETKGLPNLKELNFRHTSVCKGAVSILRALRTSSNAISHLHLQLSSSEIGHDAVEELRKLLMTSHTLSCLEICRNRFSSESLQLISFGLAISTSLTLLDLSLINFDQPAIEHLSAALGVNHALRELSMSCCNIGSDGAHILAQVFEENKTLKVLYVQENEIGEGGAKAFAKMLERNQSLKKLSLFDKSIWFSGVFTLLSALEHNDTLEILFLHEKCNPPELANSSRYSFVEYILFL